MVNKLKVGLLISIIIGILVALFPLYSASVAPLLWSEAEDGEEATYSVSGVVEYVNVDDSKFVVDGIEITVKGYWKVEGGNETLYSSDVVGMLEPGMRVTVEYTESGRWGAMAEKIVVEDLGIVIVKDEG